MSDDPDFQIPNDLSDMGAARWSPSSYGSRIIGSGAEKLSDSAVAPLVAVARGYESMTPDTFKAQLDYYVGKSPNSSEGKQLRRAAGDRDALLMPWWRQDDAVRVLRADLEGNLTKPTSLQYRPHPSHRAVDITNGKERKYENLYGMKLVLDRHPATPLTWVSEPIKTLLLTEGLLKADSALTAYLLHYGVAEDDLSLRGDESPADARKRLREFLSGIDAPNRVAVISLVGVGTWHQNQEWNSFDIRGGQVLVAFDGDVASKPQVWKQANDMFSFIKDSKKATPLLIDLSTAPAADGTKVGMDDYLASGGDWSGLLGMASTDLPPRPEGMVIATGGNYRMNNKDCWQEERVPGDQSKGIPERWERKVPVIGRITELTTLREVTVEEEESGHYTESVSAREITSDCSVEVEWKEDDERKRSIIEGPADLLGQRPESWLTSRINAAIHPEVLALPSWPPDMKWMEAMKSNRREETVRNVAWSHMGWVPRFDGGEPVYVVGRQVIDANGFNHDGAAICGVNERDLAGSYSFGVDMPEDIDQAREDLRELLRTYMACWTELGNTAIVISAGLRPVVPKPCHVPVFFSGASGAGKSYSSAAIMAFWQSRAGVWTDRRLPGSANDTAVATEIAISKTPIWVMDDLAPSTASPQKQADARAKVYDLIRAVHNGSLKRRATADATSGKSYSPRALFVVSSEFAPYELTSIMNRLVHVPVQEGFLVPSREPTDKLQAMNRDTTLASRVTGFAIRYIARDIQERGWRAVYKDWSQEHTVLSKDTSSLIERKMGDRTIDSTKRQAETTAEILLGVQLLRFLIEELDLSDEFGRLGQDMYDAVQRVAVAGFSENVRSSTGRLFLQNLVSLLSSKRAHVAAAGVAGPPCVVGGNMPPERVDWVNQQLGWSLPDMVDRPSQPNGPTIGNLVYDGETPVVLFNPSAAVSEVQRQFGRDGHNARSLWESVWRNKLTYTESWTPRKQGRNQSGITVRVKRGDHHIEGVPISLDQLLGGLSD